jgi:hypothetical protein
MTLIPTDAAIAQTHKVGSVEVAHRNTVDVPDNTLSPGTTKS